MGNWTLCIEDFGKIKKADIEISPFTLFIGDNNSGKSYLMTLIYGLLNCFGTNMFDAKPSSKAYNTTSNILLSLFDDLNNDPSETKKEILLSEDGFAGILAFLNENLHNNKEKLVTYLFNRKLSIGKLCFDTHYTPNWKISCEKRNLDMNADDPAYSFRLENNDTQKGRNLNFSQSTSRRNGFARAATKLLAVSFLSLIADVHQEKALYLPASRTGFMLTYKSLTNSSLDVAYSISASDDILNNKTTLTRPCVDFLQHINRVSDVNKKQNEIRSYKHIIDLLEKRIIDGNISTNALPSADILYKPARSEELLPLYVSSGVVTEMAPLLLLLKHNLWELILIEEPEMCLHPRLQWQFSRALIQLLNAKTNVIATTHSDTIIQHINNMIKLNSNPNSKSLLEEHGYSSKDKLDCNKVRIYQFNVQDDHYTEIQPLKCSEYGFPAPTFNNTLKEMFDESRKFEPVEEVQ